MISCGDGFFFAITTCVVVAVVILFLVAILMWLAPFFLGCLFGLFFFASFFLLWIDWIFMFFFCLFLLSTARLTYNPPLFITRNMKVLSVNEMKVWIDG